MRYDDRKPIIIRRTMFAVMVIVTVLLQNNAYIVLHSFKAGPLLFLPLVICISMFERETVSAVFGAFAGVLADISSGYDGFNAFVLVLICASVSLLISHFMRNNIITAVVLSASGIFVYQLLCIIICLFTISDGFPINSVLYYYIPSFAVTLLFIPLYYWLIKTVYEHFKTEG